MVDFLLLRADYSTVGGVSGPLVIVEAVKVRFAAQEHHILHLVETTPFLAPFLDSGYSVKVQSSYNSLLRI